MKTAIPAIAIASLLVAAAPSLTGCAGPIAKQTTTSKSAQDDSELRAYDLGFKHGKSAGERGLEPKPEMRHPEDEAAQAAYASGYRDGYAGRDNRTGDAQTRDWMTNDNDGDRK
jgi:hypothetical protein